MSKNEKSEENLSEVKNIIEKDAIDLNYLDSNGDSPLLIAIETGNLEMIELLLIKGASPNFCGYTLPLNAAIDIAVASTKSANTVLEDSTEIIELLLKYGADINQKDNAGESAIDFAKDYHISAQKLFEKIHK